MRGYIRLVRRIRDSRQMYDARRSKATSLHVLYRMQASGRPAARLAHVTALLTWLEREHRWIPADPWIPTPGRLKRVLASFNAVRAAQRDTIRLLTYLTRPIVNGESPTQIFAKLEDARHHLEWGRGRKLRRHAEETGLQARLADESAQQARLDAALAAQAADPDSYRIQWHPEGPLQEARR